MASQSQAEHSTQMQESDSQRVQQANLSVLSSSVSIPL